jgi:hypothetical protein
VTPAADDLFEVGDSCDLSPSEKARFHSEVVKLLYLAKIVRPEILTAISYLTSRVQYPNKNERHEKIKQSNELPKRYQRSWIKTD